MRWGTGNSTPSIVSDISLNEGPESLDNEWDLELLSSLEEEEEEETASLENTWDVDFQPLPLDQTTDGAGLDSIDAALADVLLDLLDDLPSGSLETI